LAVSQGKSQIPSDSGAESGAPNHEIDADLAQIVTAWPALPATAKAAILAIAAEAGAV
jgi:hypothetical protein